MYCTAILVLLLMYMIIEVHNEYVINVCTVCVQYTVQVSFDNDLYITDVLHACIVHISDIHNTINTCTGFCINNYNIFFTMSLNIRLAKSEEQSENVLSHFIILSVEKTFPMNNT